MFSFIWNDLILNPMINALLVLYDVLGGNFVLALTVFTVGIRLLTLPLNLRQQRSMLRAQEFQPQIKAIQEKYRDNPQKMQEEFQKIGYNPAESLAGCFPLLIQMPILFGLYRAIYYLLGSTPQSLFALTERAYNAIDLTQLLPLQNEFLWLNLGQPDPWFVLPFLVFATMFIQQKVMTPPKKEEPETSKKKKNNKPEQPDPTQSMTQTMQYTMPIMFGFISMQFAAGLSIYFIIANLIGIAQGWYIRVAMADARAESEVRKAERQKLVDGGSEDAPQREKGSTKASQNGTTSNKKRKRAKKN